MALNFRLVNIQMSWCPLLTVIICLSNSCTCNRLFLKVSFIEEASLCGTNNKAIIREVWVFSVTRQSILFNAMVIVCCLVPVTRAC